MSKSTVIGVFKLTYHDDKYSLSITMRSRDRFVTPILVLLAIFACGVSAKYQNYGRILKSADHRRALAETLALLTPEKLLTRYTDKIAVYADDESWQNSNCNRDLLILMDAVGQRQMWALKMLDASTKLQSGLLQGNLVDLGQYDECMAIHRADEPLPGADIRGRHCMYSISVSFAAVEIPVNPTQSICLPASCSANDIKTIFNETISKIDVLEGLTIEIASSTCSPIDPIVWDFEVILCVTVLASFVTFLIACTILEMRQRRPSAGHDTHPFVDTLAMFSLRKNVVAIFDTEIKEGTIPALHGIRFLSIAWVVLGHEYVTFIGGTVNALDFIKWGQSWNSLHVFLAQFSVDTFFAMSGFLMTYLFLKHASKQKTFNVPMYYLHRYFRLTPAVIALIVLTSILLPKLGSGPRWNTFIELYASNCQTNWWPTLLYVQNFVSKENMCLGHSWYLAVDMQLFWISPMILYPLHRKPKLGLIILTGLLLASVAIPATVIGIKQLPVMSFFQTGHLTNILEIFTSIYIIPYHRAGPWLIGIFLGYEVATHDRRLNKWSVAVGWVLAIASFAFCTFGLRSFMVSDYEYDVVWETFFSAVCRPIWAVGVCWIIYACIKNRAGPLSTILSSRIFLPLSRLSYCIYLVHLVFQTMHSSGARTVHYFSDYYVWHSFFSSLTISIVVALLFSLFFESPIMVLEKILFKRKPESRSESRKELSPNKDEESKAEKP